MLGAMQNWELRVSMLLDHAAREFAGREIYTRWADGSESFTNWAGIRHDALRMVQALRRMGIVAGDRIGTLALNHAHHLVAWYGVAGVGGILHTVNPRLYDEQLEYIINHAEDRLLIYDRQFQPIIDRLRDKLNVEHYICFDDGRFDAWIGAEDGQAEWYSGSERDACMLCYTSGTTGNPKGVIYEHRSTVLHAMACLQPALFGMDSRTVLLPIVPMFHAASWGLPWACAVAGAKVVTVQGNDPATICEVMRQEGVTHSAGVPTVWLSILQHLDATGETMPQDLSMVAVGGAAMPRAMIERLMRQDINVKHLWGMTETSPIGTSATEPTNWEDMTFDEQVNYRTRQGRVPFGVEIRCVSLDDKSVVLPRDGVSAGALQVRGPWILKRYFKAEQDSVDAGQWFDTGDVAVIHPDNTMQLTDRTKDVIKSGGEWISSVELENAAMGHPAIAEAAAIGIFHPKWDERPLLVCVKKDGRDVSAEDVRAFLADKMAKWWLPDAVEFVDTIPHTGTGKISKKDLREQFRDYRLNT